MAPSITHVYSCQNSRCRLLRFIPTELSERFPGLLPHRCVTHIIESNSERVALAGNSRGDTMLILWLAVTTVEAMMTRVAVARTSSPGRPTALKARPVHR